IRPEGEDPRITQTHYIHRMAVEIGEAAVEVPLEIADIRRDEVRAALALFSCEWGRIFDRQGTVCRALLPRTGVRKGGHVLLKWPEQNGIPVFPIELSFDVFSEGAREDLAVDYLDVGTVAWQRLETIGSKQLGNGWTRIQVRGILNRIGGRSAAAGAATRLPADRRAGGAEGTGPREA